MTVWSKGQNKKKLKVFKKEQIPEYALYHTYVYLSKPDIKYALHHTYVHLLKLIKHNLNVYLI